MKNIHVFWMAESEDEGSNGHCCLMALYIILALFTKCMMPLKVFVGPLFRLKYALCLTKLYK